MNTPGLYIKRWPGAAINNRIYWPIVLRAVAYSIESGGALSGHHIAHGESNGVIVDSEYSVIYDFADIDCPRELRAQAALDAANPEAPNPQVNGGCKPSA